MMLSGTWRVETVEEIDSTNVWLATKAREGAGEGLVLRANFQRRGRGRMARTWTAPPNSSLLCSILLRPAVANDQLQVVVWAVALAARAAVERCAGLGPSLKWPNDLLIDGRKVAGILAELVTTPAGPAIVAGIGVNCTAVDSTVTTATSIAEATGHDVAPATLLEALLVELTSRRPLLDSPEGLAELRAEYRANLGTLGQAVRVELADGMMHGVAVDVNETGSLVVASEGRDHVVNVGDVIHLRPEETV